MRVYDNGRSFKVVFHATDAKLFRSYWPSLSKSTWVQPSVVKGEGAFTFSKAGKLLESTVKANTDDWIIFIDRCKKYGLKRLAERKSTVKKNPSRRKPRRNPSAAEAREFAKIAGEQVGHYGKKGLTHLGNAAIWSAKKGSELAWKGARHGGKLAARGAHAGSKVAAKHGSRGLSWLSGKLESYSKKNPGRKAPKRRR